MEVFVSIAIGILVFSCVDLACSGAPCGFLSGSWGRAGGELSKNAARALCRAIDDTGVALLGMIGAAVRPHLARCCTILADLGERIGLPRGDADARGIGVAFYLSVVSAMAGGLVSGSLAGALLGLIAPALSLSTACRNRARAERLRVEREMPEAFGSLAISLGSGYSLARAMRFVASHSREPVRSEFARVGFSIECGVPAVEALDAMLSRFDAPGLGLVALALKVSKRTGAPPGDLLMDASRYVGERVGLRRTLDVKTAQARMSAHVVAAMPVVMMAFLLAFSTDYRAGAATMQGLACMVVACLLDGIAWVVIKGVMEVGV